ncbi:MAG TPA: hypothetical protein VNZ49_05835 [Bacteroidia bacterium]|jgi:hypothetical protein|nr:hypothetical protein [Bacteroidia bacterium]
MPRKEGPPIEERMQRAKELAELKERRHQSNLKELYASRLYRFARKSSIAFLWISQLILIDWALPYREEKDAITDGYFKTTSTEQMRETPATFRPAEVFIRTNKNYTFFIDYPEDSKEIVLNDSLIIYKSFLLNDFKKVCVPRIGEHFFIYSAVTFKFLPAILICAALSLMFIFIKNIEVKAFAWMILLFTSVLGVFLIGYLVMTYH